MCEAHHRFALCELDFVRSVDWESLGRADRSSRRRATLIASPPR